MTSVNEETVSGFSSIFFDILGVHGSLEKVKGERETEV